VSGFALISSAVGIFEFVISLKKDMTELKDEIKSDFAKWSNANDAKFKEFKGDFDKWSVANEAKFDQWSVANEAKFKEFKGDF
jgi:hypothetical protein